MTVFEIPVRPSTNQRMSVSLNGTPYGIKLRWNVPAACWMMDISDALGTLLVGGVALVPGVNLLAQYEYVGIGGAMAVQDDTDPSLVPTFDSLGATSHLYFSPAA